MNYWKDVPLGIWTITDPVDAVNALNDQDSRIFYDAFHDRINVFGETGKAVIIDLIKIRAKLPHEDIKIRTILNDKIQECSSLLKELEARQDIKEVTVFCCDLPVTDLAQIKQGEIKWKS